MPAVKLCHHTKDDGKLCGSPAMKRRTFCYFHLELRRRRQRIARIQLANALKKEAVTSLPDYEPWQIRNLLVKSFDPKTLRDTFGINLAASRLYEPKGRGVDG